MCLMTVAQLNLKNDTLRRRYDSLKYDLKKIEEGNDNDFYLPHIRADRVQSFMTYLYEIFVAQRYPKSSRM